MVGPRGAERLDMASIPPAPPSSVNGADRRAHRRAPLDRPVLLETTTRTSTARIIDVSGGGLAMKTDASVALGENVCVYFELPFGYAVEAKGPVVRKAGDTVAIQFTEAAREALIAVRSYCRMSGLNRAVTAPTPVSAR